MELLGDGASEGLDGSEVDHEIRGKLMAVAQESRGVIGEVNVTVGVLGDEQRG